MKLTQDWGVKSIDGYSNSDSNSVSPSVNVILNVPSAVPVAKLLQNQTQRYGTATPGCGGHFFIC